jgi:hypothetical protein
LIILPILLTLLISPVPNTRQSSQVLETINPSDNSVENSFSISQETQEGVFDPNSMTQRGYQETSLIRARTDSGKNAQQNITIDEANDWTVSESVIEVTNLRKLYALNGTFENEVDPWTSSLYDASGGSQVQSAVWNSTEGYVDVVNYGELTTHPSKDDTYTHHLDSELIWEQTVVNSPQTENFSLSFSYRYVSGPVDLEPYDFNGDVELRIYIHTDVYYLSIATGDLRGVWYSITDYPIELTGAPASFDVGLGIYIEYQDLVLTENGDYDDDGSPDGLVNAQKIEVNFDNIEFTSETPVPFAEVDLTFDVEGSTAAITGPTGGIGTSTITNPSFWDVDPLEIEVMGNSSVSFDYYIITYFQRTINSSWTTDLTEHGVSYSIDAGQSADLELFTYITSSAEYENLTLEIQYPTDWENTTIWDPLQSDVTGLCTVSSGFIHVPNSLFDRVGWWKITHQAFNYAKNISVQILDGGWLENSLFRTGNITRTHVEIGTASVTPESSRPLAIDWILPNGTVWYSDLVGSIVGGVADSTSLHFGGTNSTAGQWIVEILWNNGTEIAYGYTTFDLYHQSSVSASFPVIQTDHGLVISNQITLTDTDSGEYLMDDSVTIEANWSSTTVTFSQNYAKNWWQADFDTSLIGSGEFVVEVTASRPYFDVVVTQFTVITIRETTLDITNAGPLPVENGLNEIFTVQMDYDLLNGSGVPGALPTLLYTGPGGGLSWNSFTDYGDGQYSIDIICNQSATYEVSISLSRAFHYNLTDSFTLIIGETGSEFELLNGTADFVLFGDSYRLLVEYRNSTGFGLPGADIEVVTITPSTGLIHANFSHVSDGFYEITLTPTSAGTYSVVISAEFLNHETQYATFTITATGIPTVLTSLPSSVSIAIDHNFTVQVRFQDESLNPIDSATVVVVNPPVGILISNATPLGGGLYNFTLTPLELGSFDLLFRASSNNYQSSSAAFTLSATEIPTHLEFAGGVSSTLVEFSTPYQLTIFYYRSDTMVPVNVDGASLTVLIQDPGLVIDIDEFVGYYVVTIRGEAIGSWSLTVSANKTDHHVATKQFLFQVEEIDTSISGVSPMESLLFGRSYQFDFDYMFESNSSNIFGATIMPFGEGADWLSYVELGSGQYSVNLTPLALGEFSVLLTFEKTGFETVSYRLTFTVVEVPVSINVLEGLQGPEGSSITLTVSLTETDTGNPVTNATVFYDIRSSGGAPLGDPIVMSPTNIPGVYYAQIEMPYADGVYYIEISCEVVNYVLEEPFSEQLQPSRDLSTLLYISFRDFFWIYLGVGALGVGMVYRRRARKNRIRQNKITLAIKKRFDDVRSLLGVIVLHKDSGLPVYSKILRDGLEEAVISAFITAVTSFRGEFDIESSSEEWGLIPISDIVRVVSTDKLVCAFITTGNPSAEQRERMIQFAKTVGFIFDDSMSDVPIVVLDHHTTLQFDSLFDDILDGALLRTYKLDDAKKFPTSSCADERIAQKHGEEFKLEELATEIASCGLEEGRVYQAIMKALENHLLVSSDDSPFSTQLVRAPESIESEG